MINQLKVGLITLVGVAIWAFAPGVAHAAKAHITLSCNECHKAPSTANPRAMGNLCVNCHLKSDPAETPVARFNVGAASNALMHNPTPGSGSGASTSHFWGGNPTAQAAAGSANPSKAFYASRYSISTGRITCSICHDPHGEFGTKLVRAATAGDLICQQCHQQWFVNNADAVLTHPIVADYAAIAAANPTKFNATVANVPGGDVRLVNGGVSCTSCHATHYADSSAATIDGAAVYNNLTMAQGDGNILRTDGPLRTGGSRDTAVTGTAQLRSNLCQACHTYKMHGKGGNDQMIGCLDCHGGHGYNGGTPNAFVLASQSPDAVPVRANRAPNGTASVDYPNYPDGGSTRTKWSDDTKGTANGLCEKCHGDVQDDGVGGLGLIELQHLEGSLNECDTCHVHSDPGFSFANDANAATCGACHGFPPYKNISGFRATIGDANDGGYADNQTWNYSASSGHFKDETKTAHKTHAGAALSANPGEWYFVGASGIANCKVCHGDAAATPAGNHQVAPGTDPNTFRNVPFNAIAKAGTNLVPSFNTTDSKCYNVYCHTNGAPRTGNGPTRSYAGVNTTPSWIGTGANYAGGGYGSIFLQAGATRCADCHGNTAATMITKSNSARHQEHLGGGEMGITFGCEVCHFETAASATALAAGATDGRTGGEHVNSIVDVAYKTSGGSLYTSLNVNTTGVNYDPVSGTCSVYCHDPADTGNTADWDGAANNQCDTCHGGLASDTSGNGGVGPITTGSHTRHTQITGTGPKLLCAECHDTGADAGTHAGHIDGVVTMKPPVNGVTFANICQECHGYDAQAGEVLPVWGSPATTDCATCHAGNFCGETINGKDPVAVSYARTTGHNRPTSAGTYTQSANPAANLGCSSCHITDSAGHWNGITGDDLLLKSGSGFPATYAGNENNFCGNCHGAAGSAVKNNINTHQSKLCVACHNVHGDQNIQMIWTSQADQLSHDSSGTGKFAADVFFSNVTSFLAGNLDSYDEDDGAVGGTGEVNSDDICATCHSTGAGTTHNNGNNSTVTHYQGADCFTCHASHTDSTDAFKLGAGTACNDCHGFPPATGAHRKGALITDPELHSNTSGNLDTEDRTDCAFCHTGADLYTYDLGADQGSANPDRNNHAVSQANRRAVLTAAVGYETTNFSCATACHKSNNGDGEWDDVNGLNCNACHYAAASPTSAGNVTATNSEAVSAGHNKHFDKSKGCTECHDVSYSPTIVAIRGVLTHITAPDYTGAGNDGSLLQGRANAVLDEATVVRTSMTYSGGVADAGGANNTCAGGIGLSCHASGSPDWDVTIPATSAGCVMCHTETNSAAYNPTSGLHDNSPGGPSVTGNSHDGSFDNGSAGIADCVTCHTASPTGVAANHINGTLNTGTAITVAAIAGYTQGTASCATTCHSAGTVWSYKWSTSAYNTNGTECANCHGDYASGWITGVSPHTEVATKGNKHNNVGNLTYPCADCHAIGTAGYNWTSKWNPNAASSHGDDKITINQVAGTNTFTIDAAPTPDRAGCVNLSCHNPSNLTGDTNHTFRITTTSFTTQTVTGNPPEVLCSGCHGGTIGTNANGYWPDGVNTAGDNASEDNSGAHLKHITALANTVMGQSIAQLLTDNVGVGGAPWNTASADTKQKELCTYCHGTTSNPIDATHGLTSYLPADVSTMFTLWGKAADNGVWSIANRTCDTVDCHFNKLTPTAPTNFSWYGGQASACLMCHVDVTAEAKHTAHTGAATTFGKTIVCANCHQAATNWSTNTPPAANHLSGGTLEISNTGNIPFTYDGSKSCGTNDCHEDGKGGAPKTASYPWNGAALGNCTICHDASPTTDAHTKHLAAKVTNYVSGSCNDCHSAATNAAHINNSVTYASKISAAPGNGSCTNTCHLSPQAGDWATPGAIACTDCHSGSGASAYIGGDKTSVPGPNYMPQYNMHLTVPTVSGKIHTDTGLSTTCDFCHSNMAAQAANHPNGIWTADDADNTNDQNRGMFAAFIDGSPATCATSCHSAGTAWRYKWSATASATGGSQCANCHGTFTDGWTTGTVHATNPTRGNGAHTDTGTGGFPCTDCHSLGSSNNAYPYTVTTNDWKPTEAGTTLHGDGKINMNITGTAWARSGSRSGCSQCHEGATGTANAHDFATSTITNQNVAGVAPNVSGGCTTCHGNIGSGDAAPDGSAYPDRAGKHLEHITAIAIKLGGDTSTNRNASCDYCHLNPGESGHNTNSAPLNAADVNNIRRIIGGAADSNPVINGQGTNYVTCSNIDCHFDQPITPHWYTDDIAPAAVTLTAVAGPKPRSVKVSWIAPGDDNNVVDTTPYVYDLRIGTDAATSQNFGLTTNYAGNLPAAYKQGSVSEAIIQNLDVGTPYYFTLKSRDTAGNWSTISNTVSASPTADTTAPAFGGANKAIKADASQTVYLTWTAAEDHTMPITYKVWQKTEAAGALNMNVDTPLLTGVKGHNIVLTGLTNDTIYNFGVRACDANNNCDTNTQIVSATPTADPLVTKTNHTYRTNGAATLVKDGAAGTAVTAQALPKVFAPGANNTYSVNYYVDTFAVYLNNASATTAATIRATLGYSTTGSDFTSLGVTKDVAIPKKTARVYMFKIVDVAGKTINSGQRLAIQLSNFSGSATASYGSTAYRGDLTVSERILNVVPTNPNVNATVSGANVNVTWTASTDTVDGLADTVHYDLFGSDDNGSTYRYLIASELPATTTNYSWDTQSDGISGSATVAIKLLPGDDYGHYTGAVTTKTALAVNNSTDNVAPAAITDLQAKARPKAGSVELTWTSPGDDAYNNGRAKYYDIRYSTAAITEGNFSSASQCVNEPSPDFGGKIQGFEVTGLTPGQNFYFAIKTYDDGTPAKVSAISTAKSVGSDQSLGGPRCGMCHTTAPSIVESVGNHKLHGFTITDCTKCHGSVVASYGLDHQDGQLKMGYGPAGPVVGTIAGNQISYTDTTTSKIMYNDTDGFGGFGNGNYASAGDGLDDGTCINFGAMGVGGCHSAAGTDPDGAGTLPTYPTPTWTDTASLNCAACHGNPNRTIDSFYGRPFDATTANAGVVPDQIKGAPAVDNHGNYDLADPDEKDRKFIGQHEKHLNYSFRFSKGDNCNLCHAGNYRDVNDLDGKHANGDVDVKLDIVAAGSNATWTPGTAITAGTCSSMSPETCHPSASSPKWDSSQNFDCVGCHNMGGTLTNIGHYTDPIGGITIDTDTTNTNDGGPMLGNCTWCHFAGHPRDDVGGTALILANSSQVGINYKSGGIHLRKSIAGRAAQATEAELCWSCHDAQTTKISEWGTDTGANNVSTRPPNASDYDYGTVNSGTSSKWIASPGVGASWSSSVANFSYKTGAIRSTHSTNETGSSAVTGAMETYTEAVDAVAKIRCSNCHDVHNLNKAPGDTMTGQPYLRGTWIRNPYPEDGAPWGKTYAVNVALYGAVPRAGGNEQGGYQIDQNNSYPTAGMSLATSAGLCTLCHGTNVDGMDKTTGENLWVGGTNGHSNATLGGTASVAANIFGDGIGGRSVPSGTFTDTSSSNAERFNMGLQVFTVNGYTGRGYAYRNAQSAVGALTPTIGASQPYAYNAFTWGVTVDAGTTDIGYHAFTCSKCHNPHASRLPKLMITNCLDTQHNTWQSSAAGQGNTAMTGWTSPDDNGEKAATWNTAQNCHRYDSVDNLGGWNKVTPW